MHGIITLVDVHQGGASNHTLENPVRVGITRNLIPIQNENNEEGSQLGRPLGSPQLAPLAVAPTKIAPTLGDIIGAYKSLVTNACMKICNSQNIRLGKLWQRDYYEIIIRNEQAYQRISHYIINNPAKWDGDKFFKKGNS